MGSDKKLIIANWKMKLTLGQSLALAKDVKDKFQDFSNGTVAVCPNFVSLTEVRSVLDGGPVKLGAQDVFWEENGAYTGEISASMLEEAGCDYVIVGHSERRKYLMVNYEMIHKEINSVINAGNLIPIVCIGENWDERKTDRRDYVLYDQMQQALTGIDISGDQIVVVAYEPIWAIGSGTAIEPDEAEYAHKIIKLTLNDMYGMKKVSDNFRIIYGGSINSKNVGKFVGLENLDGLLVGGASLNADEFHKVASSIATNK